MNAYKLIQRHYRDKTAERSGVPLINHIDEGLRLLRKWDRSENMKDAWCLHPLVQDDEMLFQTYYDLTSFHPETVMLVMEYRNIANQGLRANVIGGDSNLRIIQKIELSPIDNVNVLLMVDKIQNRKDFEKYFPKDDPDYDLLRLYFREWFHTLRISEERYIKCKEIML